VTQPRVEPLDLDRPAEEIRAAPLAACRDDPGFRPVEEWRAAFAERLASPG
jgi:hypothetical protein